jgi:outer membrane protein assembly factor BamD
MEERLNVAKTAYAGLIKFKTDTKYEQADDMLAELIKIYKNLLNN